MACLLFLSVLAWPEHESVSTRQTKHRQLHAHVVLQAVLVNWIKTNWVSVEQLWILHIYTSSTNAVGACSSDSLRYRSGPLTRSYRILPHNLGVATLEHSFPSVLFQSSPFYVWSAAQSVLLDLSGGWLSNVTFSFILYWIILPLNGTANWFSAEQATAIGKHGCFGRECQWSNCVPWKYFIHHNSYPWNSTGVLACSTLWIDCRSTYLVIKPTVHGDVCCTVA